MLKGPRGGAEAVESAGVILYCVHIGLVIKIFGCLGFLFFWKKGEQKTCPLKAVAFQKKKKKAITFKIITFLKVMYLFLF